MHNRKLFNPLIQGKHGKIPTDVFGNTKSVLPAKAGIQMAGVFRWIPVYTEMTTRTQEGRFPNKSTLETTTKMSHVVEHNFQTASKTKPSLAKVANIAKILGIDDSCEHRFH